MDRLGDLNLINASAVCSRGHVPFCQDIGPILLWLRVAERDRD